MPRKAKGSIQERLKAAIDENILDVLENGMPVQDENGKVQRIPPNAAFINAAIRWHQQSNGGASEERDGIAATLDQLRRAREAGGAMPDVDDEGEDGATAA